jgi:hypothetical protein
MLWFLNSAGISRAAATGIIIAALLAIAGIGAAVTMWVWSAAIADARSAGRDEMKARYEALIAKSNAEAEAAHAAAARAAAAAEAEAARLAATLSETLAKMEAADAALPNGDSCGLDAGRLRLLP